MEHSCGNTEAYRTRTEAMAAEVKLQTNRPLYLIKDPLPGRTIDQTAAMYEKAFARWGKADIKTRRITDMAEAGPGDVVNVVSVADLGGGGVLADQQLPNGSARLPMRMNSRIQWAETDGPMSGGIDPVRVFCHEQGHFLGHEHWPKGAPPELMEPFISDGIIAPQPTEMAVTVGWFGNAGDPPDAPGGCPTLCQAVLAALKQFNKARHTWKGNAMTELLTQQQQQAVAAVGEACKGIDFAAWLKILQQVLGACPAAPIVAVPAGASPCAGLGGLGALIPCLQGLASCAGIFCKPPA